MRQPTWPRLPAVLAAALTLLGACGGGDDDTDYVLLADLSPMLITLDDEGVAAACPNGGRRVVTGFDADGNGRLGAEEIASAQYVCNGNAGSPGGNGLSVVARTIDEAAGAHCAAGGKALQVGWDRDADGMLDANEVSDTAYLCNGTNGMNGTNGADGATGSMGPAGNRGLDTLAVSEPEDAGQNCPYGGTRLRSGLDIDGDRLLDAPEVKTTSYLCSPPPTILPWIEVTGGAVPMEANTGYVVRNGEQVELTLPRSPAIGAIVRVAGAGAGGWSVAQNSGQLIDTRSLGGVAGRTWSTGLRRGNWESIASSGDGRKLVAYDGTPDAEAVYVSQDGGISWNVSLKGKYPTALASSLDGNTLVAARFLGELMVSIDGGATWSARVMARRWRDVCVSADGGRIVAVVEGTDLSAVLAISIDGGERFDEGIIKPSLSAIACSANGQGMLLATSNEGLFRSSSWGAGFEPSNPEVLNWRDVASSADGNRLAAAVHGGPIYVSTNGGASWERRGPVQAWRSIAMSADGRRLAAVGDNTEVYVSDDGGLTWSSAGGPRARTAVAMSAAGDRMVATWDHEGATAGSVQVSWSTTTPGTAGGIAGGTGDALELQYVGDGRFIVLSHEGQLSVR